MSNYITKTEYANAKRRLTKAENALKRAETHEEKIKAAERLSSEAQATLLDWDRRQMALPDDWHRWQRAMDDAIQLWVRLSPW